MCSAGLYERPALLPPHMTHTPSLRLWCGVTVAGTMATRASPRCVNKHAAACSPINSSLQALHTSASSSTEYDLPIVRQRHGEPGRRQLARMADGAADGTRR